jgi:hypothetical protein
LPRISFTGETTSLGSSDFSRFFRPGSRDRIHGDWRTRSLAVVLAIQQVLQERRMTISLRLDAKLKRKLASAAKAEGLSKSALIRKCLDKYLTAEEQRPTAWELGKHLFGCFDSGTSDLSVRAGEIARERIHARRAKKSRH